MAGWCCVGLGAALPCEAYPCTCTDLLAPRLEQCPRVALGGAEPAAGTWACREMQEGHVGWMCSLRCLLIALASLRLW